MKSTKISSSILFIILILVCNSCKSPTGPVLEDLIGDWSNKINTIIQTAQNAGLILEVTAASQAKNLIEQVRITYEGELDKTVDAFSLSEQKSFDDISKAITGLNAGVTNALTNMQNIVSMLPGMKLTPQINECLGTIIAPNQENYKITLNGSFWNAAEKDYHATLKINGTLINSRPNTNNTHVIEFEIPKTIFKFSDSRILYDSCEINIDYQKTKLLLLHSKVTATFNEELVVLPPKFGEVTLETSVLQDSTFVEVNKECGPFVWSSKDGNNHNEILGCDMEPGWSCDISSVHWRMLGQEGSAGVDWFDQGNVPSSTGAHWKMLTTPKSGLFGHDGVIFIQLIYNRYLTKKVDVVKRSDLKELNWGNKIVLGIPRDAIWKLIFTKYDGNTFEIASDKEQSSLIKIENLANRQISIQVVPFNTF